MNEFIKNELKLFFKRVKEHKHSYPFRQPIQEIIDTIPEYTKVIERPIDLVMIENNLTKNYYTNIEDFKNDLDTLINNCIT